MEEQRKFLWYMISTISGKEDMVLESLENRVVAEEVHECFDYSATENGPFKIFKVPKLTAKEMEKKRQGLNYKIKWDNMYPGYLFIKMDMTDKAWFVIRNTQHVTGLVGSSGKGAKPTPISNLQIKKCFKKEAQAIQLFDEGKNLMDFKVGDIVTIKEGSFQGEIGPIKEINVSKNTAIVLITQFNKPTPLEISLDVLERS